MARFGLPRVVVTDNGPQFSSELFSKFLSGNGIKHLPSPPFHPATNGFAENAVKSFKNGLYKAIKDNSNRNVSFETLMSRYLFHYRNSVHSTTGVSPSSLVFRHKIRNRFDLLSSEKSRGDENVKDYKGVSQEQLKVNDKVLCREYRNPNRKAWCKALSLAVK